MYLNEFASTMDDFSPDETFSFNLSTYEQQDFIFWPSSRAKGMKGVFYITEGLDDD